MKKETRACWFRDPHTRKWTGGKFHEWGYDCSEVNAMVSVAIIEREDNGRCLTLPVDYVCFATIPPSE